MPVPPPATIAALRSLVAAWTPPSAPAGRTGVATGVPAIDAALGGGLVPGRFTELVAAAPSCGAGLVLDSLLAHTRAGRQRVALVDAADGFSPADHPADHLRHLVWVRARSLAEALRCTDVLVRDGNYAVVVLDLRGVPARALRQQPSTLWHRLRLAAEAQPAAVLVLSPAPVVPAVPWRLVLPGSAALAALRLPRSDRIARLAAELARGAPAAAARLAG